MSFMMESPDVKALTIASPEQPRFLPPAEFTPPRPVSPALRGGAAASESGSVDDAATIAAAARDSPAPGNATLKLDMSVGAPVSALVHQLVQPLAVHYSHTQVMRLRKRLAELLTDAFRPTWNETNPHSGSGSRSLIADRIHGLPAVLRRAAGSEIDLAVWSKAIASTRRRKAENEDEEAEWEVWCDPGMVVWRWGGWGWDEVEFDPIKRPRESFQIIWQAAPTATAPELNSPPTVPTPLRQSKAIPIRAPTLVNMPATPSTPTPLTSPIHIARPESPALLPAVDLTPTPTKVRQVSGSRDYGSIGLGNVFRPNGGHKGTDSTSSHSSDSSDTNSHTQLLTPASRPGSADLFPEDGPAKRERSDRGSKRNATKPTTEDDDEPSRSDRETTPENDTPSRRSTSTPVTTPTVIPYDGGNVTVLGGGTKLGGSRPPSAASRGDRTRSPSVSITSRALSNAVGPNLNGGATSSPGSPSRKHRPRRRIMPTYLGHFGQPGIGAPMMGAFGMQSIKTGQPGYSWPHNQPGLGGVGVGVAPPPVSAVNLANQMGMPLGAAGTKRMAS